MYRPIHWVKASSPTRVVARATGSGWAIRARDGAARVDTLGISVVSRLAVAERPIDKQTAGLERGRKPRP
jgi:hypothetical protein